jgi:hypothetical protein
MWIRVVSRSGVDAVLGPAAFDPPIHLDPMTDQREFWTRTLVGRVAKTRSVVIAMAAVES